MVSTSNTSHYVDPDQYEPGVPTSEQADQHVVNFAFFNLMPQFNFYFSPNWDVGFQIPMRLANIDAQFLGFDGEVLDDFSSIHHRTETLIGLADIPLDVGWTLQNPLPIGHQLTLRLGATLPVGKTEPDPFELGRQGKDHQHIFFGTGTFNPTWTLSYVLGLGEHQLFLFGEGLHALYPNEHGYQSYSMVTSGTSFNYAINREWQISAIFIAFREWPAKWGDEVARNSGRVDVIPGAGVRWLTETGSNISLSAQFPVNVSTEGGQMRMPFLISLEMNWMGEMFAQNSKSTN